jgi:hypothetical protein
LKEHASDQVRLAGAVIDRYHHASAFFQGRDEEYPVVGPFVAEGLERGEKALHITDPPPRDDHLGRLADLGIDVTGARASGQLDCLTWREACLKDGRFSPDGMLAQLEGTIADSDAAEQRRVRIVGDMGWALEDRSGVNRLLEYEARVNDLLAVHKAPAVCCYDLTRFGAATMVDIMRTHPMVIIGGELRENAYFVRPDESLRELAARGGVGA